MADALKINVWDGTKWTPVALGGSGQTPDFSAGTPITHADPEITSQSSGQPIGLSPDGNYFFQPDIVAAIPIVVNGKKFMIPLINE